MLKEIGYGLGLVEYTKFLLEHGINYFAVSSVEEAIELKKSGIENVLCMEATGVQDEIETLFNNNIVITIGDTKSAKFLNDLAKKQNKKAKVHLKIDTGFSRYGICYKKIDDIINVIKNNTSIYFEGMFSHFSCAYFQDSVYTRKQYDRFCKIKKSLEENDIKIPMYHICNSSAFLKYEDMFLDAVRIGSAFLGRISVKNELNLKKIGVLKSNVVQIEEIEKGTPIGYSNSEIAKNKMKIAIAPIGYADGYNVKICNDTFKIIDKIRILKNDFENLFNKNRLFVMINNDKINVVGRVGMNHIALDITNKNVKIDDIVIIDTNPILISSKIRREYI